MQIKIHYLVEITKKGVCKVSVSMQTKYPQTVFGVVCACLA